MKTYLHLLLIALIANLTGCVSIRSNALPDAIPAFKRILVVAKTRDVSDGYLRNLKRAFPADYEVCAVALTPLTFDRADEFIQRQAALCQSDVVLTLELVQSGQFNYQMNTGSPSQFNLDMRSLTTNKSFWKAIISTSSAVGNQIPPHTVVKRLLKDGILEGKLPATDGLRALN